jgi:hypothetical protein
MYNSEELTEKNQRIEKLVELCDTKQKEINRLRSFVRKLDNERNEWVRAFPFFITHHPVNFIEDVWGNDPHMCGHLQSKHKGYCSKDGYSSYEAMMKFFHSLSHHHQETLCIYIVSWWNENKENFS